MVYHRITYSLHALAQMHDRELSTELIEDAIANADEVNRQGERLIAVREQLIGPWIRVVYVERAG